MDGDVGAADPYPAGAVEQTALSRKATGAVVEGGP